MAGRRALFPLALMSSIACVSGEGRPDSGAMRFDGGPGPASGTAFCDFPGRDVPGLTVPEGFCIRKFATVKTPRTLAFAPNGDLFIASPSSATPGGAPLGIGGIYLLPDDNGDGVADSNIIYLQNADTGSVHGLAFRGGGELLYTVSNGVFSIPYTARELSGANKPRTQIADLSSAGGRWTHSLAIAADGTLYVSNGQFDTDTCPATNPHTGAVLKIGGGHDMSGDLSINGCRNPLYLSCAPWGCYAAEMSGDSWVGIGGSEKLILIKDGDNYGYPCCVDHDLPRPDLDPPPNCSGAGSAVQSYTLHDSPFGFAFESANKWPAPYTGGLFMALHGSFFEAWRGVRVGFSPVDPNTHQMTGPMGTFVGGFGMSGPVVGRPADARFAPDGRLFFVDDAGGGVYWVAPKTLKKP